MGSGMTSQLLSSFKHFFTNLKPLIQLPGLRQIDILYEPFTQFIHSFIQQILLNIHDPLGTMPGAGYMRVKKSLFSGVQYGRGESHYLITTPGIFSFYSLNYSQHTLHFHEFQLEIIFAWLWWSISLCLTSQTSETHTPFPLFPFLHMVKETWKSASCLCFSENFLKIISMPFLIQKYHEHLTF